MILETIQAALRAVNYRRRTRTVNLRDVIQVLREALTSGYGYAIGGTVAKAYNYPASTAAVAAARIDGGIWLRFGSCDAHRQASKVTWFGPYSCRPAHLEDWRSKITAEDAARDGWILLSRRDIIALFRHYRRENGKDYARYFENLPDVLVTTTDSLDAGNCPHETARIAQLIGNSETSSRFLMRYIGRREPHLLYYARRAVDYAAQHTMEVK